MAFETACPPDDVLRGLLLGELPEAEAEGLIEHLSACSRCAAVAPTLAAEDDLVRTMRAARSVAETPRPPGLEATVAQWGAAPPAAEEAEDWTALLAPARGPDEVGRLAHFRLLRLLGRGGMGF